MLEPGPCCCAAPHLLRVFSLSWLLLSFFLSSLLLPCEVEGVVTIIDNDSTSIGALIKNTRRSTAAAAGEAAADSANVSASANNSSNVSDWAPTPGIAVSLSLSLDQQLSSNPMVHLRPTLSLSISLSVFGEMQANPFGFVIKLPLPQPAEQQDDGPSDQVQPPDQEQEQLLKQGASLQPQVKVGSSLISSRWGKCSYTVTIKTSCTSPRVTRDAVSLSFGDASRNEVYAARLDDPASGTFERCSIDTFRVVGPCGGRTCYLYLRRSGRDGWTPEYVKVFYSTGDPRAAVTFFYKVPLPDGVWYGFNLCHGGAATMPSTNLNLDALGKERGDTTDGGHRTTATATPA